MTDSSLVVVAGLAVALLLLKAALILTGATLLNRLAERASAAVRHGVWSLGIVAVLALPLITFWVPPIRVDLPAWFAAPPARIASPAPSTPEFGEAAVSNRRAAAGEAVPAAPSVADGTIAAAEPPVPFPWRTLLLTLWLVGALFRLGQMVVLLLRVRRLTGSAEPSANPRLLAIADVAVVDLGISRPVRVLQSPQLTMPITWGFLAPVVVLPAEARDWSIGRLRAVLTHEMAHIRRHDCLISLLAEIASAIYWPIPLVWSARRGLRAEQEQACDDVVLSFGTSSIEYAEHLLAIARAYYGRGRELGLAVGMAREMSLRRRIRMILDDRADRRPMRSPLGLASAGILVAVILPIAAVSGAAPEAEGDESRLNQALRELTWASGASVTEASAATTAAMVWIEAERGLVSGRASIGEDLDASSVAFVRLEDERRRGGAAREAAGELVVPFSAPADGAYVVWVRVRGSRDDRTTLRAAIEGRPEVSLSLRSEEAERNEWSWVPLIRETVASATNAPATLALAAGEHSLRLVGVEDEVRLDRILLTTDPAYRPTGAGQTEGITTFDYQLIEAERAALGGRVLRRDDDDASGGEYTTFRASRRGEVEGSASFDFEVRQAGRYLVWGRVAASDEDDNSYFVRLDDGAETIWDLPDGGANDGGAWRWDPINARNDDGEEIDPLAFELEAGHHTLQVRTREEGARLDAVLITSDLAHRPRGIWPESLPARAVSVELEVEAARLSSGFATAGDPLAGGGRFVSVEAGSRREEDPAAAGSLRLPFVIEQSGLYTLWARAIAPDGELDSFWIRVDAGAWILWNEVPRTDEWRWSAVEDGERDDRLAQFKLDPGPHTLEIAGREAGVMLDRMLLTNDPLFRP